MKSALPEGFLGSTGGEGCQARAVVVLPPLLTALWGGSGHSIQRYLSAVFHGLLKHLHRHVCALIFINAKSNCDVSVLVLFLKSCRELRKY